MNNEQLIVVLHTDKEWSSIDGELCRITNFKPLYGSTVKDREVISPNKSKSYASIEIQCEKYEKITGLITHKLDFFNLWNAFNTEGFDEKNNEILIYWTTKRYKTKLASLIKPILPKLIVMICPKSSYKLYHKVFNLSDYTRHPISSFLGPLHADRWWIPAVMK